MKGKSEFVEIIEYYDNTKGIYFKGTKKQFEEFLKFHKMYPYTENDDSI